MRIYANDDCYEYTKEMNEHEYLEILRVLENLEVLKKENKEEFGKMYRFFIKDLAEIINEENLIAPMVINEVVYILVFPIIRDNKSYNCQRDKDGRIFIEIDAEVY